MPDSTKSEDSQYFGVDIRNFRNTSRDINFDIYLRISADNYAHVFSKTTGIDYKRLAQYLKKGVRELFIQEADRKLYEEFSQKTAQEIFVDPKSSKEERIATLLNMTEQNIAEIFAQIEIEDETAQDTSRIVKNYVQLMGENPRSLTMILSLASHGDYLYYHSISVAILSMFLAKALGNNSQKFIEMIGLGGFLHDIGMTQLPTEINEGTDDLSPDQWKLLKDHTKIGLKMLESTKNIPDEVRHIVYQHHEQPGGYGYPNGLRGNVIFYPAKIVAVADSFSALISSRPFREAFSVAQAIEVMESDVGKFEPAVVQALRKIFLKKKSKAA